MSYRVAFSLLLLVVASQAAPQFPQQPQFQGQQYPSPQFQGQSGPENPMGPEPGSPQPTINWGQCPQLEPTIQEKMNKANVITKCLEVTPVPQNLTRDTVERHRESVAACALQMEGWFTPDVRYRYEKAESEIRSKKLPIGVETKVLQYHTQCKQEAEEKYPHSTQTVIHQIQLYQACMDYFISEACGIEVRMPPSGQPQQQGPQTGFNPSFQG